MHGCCMAVTQLLQDCYRTIDIGVSILPAAFSPLLHVHEPCCPLEEGLVGEPCPAEVLVGRVAEAEGVHLV